MQNTTIPVALGHPTRSEAHVVLTIPKDKAGAIKEAIATGEFQAILDDIRALRAAGLSYDEIRERIH